MFVIKNPGKNKSFIKIKIYRLGEKESQFPAKNHFGNEKESSINCRERNKKIKSSRKIQDEKNV